MKKSFTLIELLIVVIIIGILAYSLSFKFNNSLQVAADKIIKDIRYTQSLALKEDKYQPFPENNSSIEQNRSKYWFKQWWQIRFTQNKNDKNYWYEIFSDQPIDNKYNFDKVGNYPPKNNYWDIGYAKNPLTNKYMVGKCDNSSHRSYPNCNEYSPELNLSKYNIKLIQFDVGNGLKTISSNNSLRFVFDNLGNIFLDEGKKGDSGDINPLDKENRKLLVTTVKIRLCLDNPCIINKNRCININITPTGEVYKSLCN